jgi:hypothetical protein
LDYRETSDRHVIRNHKGKMIVLVRVGGGDRLRKLEFHGRAAFQDKFAGADRKSLTEKSMRQQKEKNVNG